MHKPVLASESGKYNTLPTAPGYPQPAVRVSREERDAYACQAVKDLVRGNRKARIHPTFGPGLADHNRCWLARTINPLVRRPAIRNRAWIRRPRVGIF